MRRRLDLRRFLLVLFVITLYLFTLAGAAAAQQGAAGITGQVRDESGGVLPGVTVTATSPALQVPEVSGVTGAQGEYRLTPLPVGTYTVLYTLSGFQTLRQTELRLEIGVVARLDVVLKVGALEETVTVSGAAPVVDVTSTATSTQLTRETLELTPTAPQRDHQPRDTGTRREGAIGHRRGYGERCSSVQGVWPAAVGLGAD